MGNSLKNQREGLCGVGSCHRNSIDMGGVDCVVEIQGMYHKSLPKKSQWELGLACISGEKGMGLG